MAVLVSHAQIQTVKDALASVRSNGEAYAAVQAALKAAAAVASALRSEGGSYRNTAAKDIDDYAARVKLYEKELKGSPTAAVGPTWVGKAKEQVLSLYMLMLTVQGTMPPGVDLGDGFGVALKSAVSDLPKTIGAAAKVAAQVVQTVVKETAKVGGSLVWGLVAGAWPLLAIIAIGGVGYLVLKKKLVGAVLP